MAKKVKTQVAFAPTTCAYTWLDKPDTGHTYSDNKYKATLVYDDVNDAMTVKEDGEEVDLKEVCERLALEHWGDDFDLSELRLPVRLPETQTKEDFEGKATVTPKSKYKPMAYDAKRNKLPKNVKIYSGDVAAVLATLIPYESTERVREGKKVVTVTTYGISANLSAIQLVEKRAGGGPGPGAFETYDDGFDASGMEDDEGGDDQTEGTDEEDDDGDY